MAKPLFKQPINMLTGNEIKCAECGGNYIKTTGKVLFEVREVPIEIDNIEHHVCAKCGEMLFRGDVVSKLQRLANEKYKKRHGIMSSSRIRALRQKHGITQETFETIIGAGAKSVARWEKGTVIHSEVTDTFFKVLERFPEAMYWLLGDQK
ncbi:MAG: type II toxin-antitoxin system MqsA family antitoxin [Coriobacteriia bacterium]|nr:type II toxin-antitoxin system MqsA family antitoxin [Coriobacteriia bacterium]